MTKTLGQIAEYVEGEVIGDGNLVITGLCGIKESQEGDLTFVAEPKYFRFIPKTKASAIIIPSDMKVQGKPVIRTANPSGAFAKAVSWMTGMAATKPLQGIHKTAIIADSAKLGKNVAIGPYVVIEENVIIGDNSSIHACSFIGYDTKIGTDVSLAPNTTVRERVLIGNRVIIHSGAVIGSDGFGFTTDKKGVHSKIPQIGTVVIEDDVEIGSCVTIDRARFDKTLIGRGTKIDNLVHIAHNVIIGENCLIIAQVGISGSVVIEKNAILAGQSGVAGHLTIGEGAIVASKAGVTKSVPAHTTVFGFPAQPHMLAKRLKVHYRRLPETFDMIEELKARVSALENELKSKKKKDNA